MLNTNLLVSCLLYFFSFVSSPEPTENAADEQNKTANFQPKQDNTGLLKIDNKNEIDFAVEVCNLARMQWENKQKTISTLSKQELLQEFEALNDLKKSLKNFNQLRQLAHSDNIPSHIKTAEIPVFNAVRALLLAIFSFENELEDTIEALPDFNEVLFNAIEQNMENAKFIMGDDAFWDLIDKEKIC